MVSALEQIPGAVAAKTAPSTALGSVWESSSQNLVDRHRFVTVPGTLATVLAWVKAHPPAGFVLSAGESGGSDHLEGQSFTVGVGSRTELAVVGVQVGGRVGVRIDGEVTWVPRKTAVEDIPATVTRATVDYTGPTMSFGTPPGGPVTTPKPRHADRVATGKPLAAIVNDLNGLVEGTPYTALSCPLSNGEHVDIGMDFGRRHVVYSMDFSGCPEVDVTSNGHKQPYLYPDAQLVTDVYAVVGVVETPIPRAPAPGPAVTTKPRPITVLEKNAVDAQRVGDRTATLSAAGASTLHYNSGDPSRPPYAGKGTAVDRGQFYSVPGRMDQLIAWYRAHPVRGTVAAEPYPAAAGVRRLVMEPTAKRSVRAMVWVSMVQRGDHVDYRIDAQTAWLP